MKTIKIILSRDFDKSFKKLDRNLQIKTLKRLEVFKKNWRHPSLKTHKLKGNLSEIYSFRVTYSVRVLFKFITPSSIILIIDIGQHDEIY